MPHTAGSAGTPVQFTGMGLGVLHQAVQICKPVFIGADHDARCVKVDRAQRGEVITGEFRISQSAEGGQIGHRHGDGITICFGISQFLQADGGRTALHVFADDADAQDLLHLRGDGAGDQIAAAAQALGNDHGDVVFREGGLSAGSLSRFRRSGTFAGGRGLRGLGLLSASRQGEGHCYRHENCKCFFHVRSSNFCFLCLNPSVHIDK